MNSSKIISNGEDHLLKTADFLKSLGPVSEKYRAPDPHTRIVDDKTTMKCACDKVVRVMDMAQRHSGVVRYVDNICPGCEEQAKGLATVICVRCHRVAGRLPPQRDKYGFKIEPGKVYHLEKCPICSPHDFAGQQYPQTPIIEMILYHRKVGVKS